jgi:hypothetical protein
VGCGNKSQLAWIRGREEILEMDIFDASTADTIIRRLESSGDLTVWVHRLTVMVSSGELVISKKYSS